MEEYGKPGISNPNQACQCTTTDFAGVLERGGITISMEGKGRYMGNIIVEWLWRSLK